MHDTLNLISVVGISPARYSFSDSLELTDNFNLAANHFIISQKLDLQFSVVPHSTTQSLAVISILNLESRIYSAFDEEVEDTLTYSESYESPKIQLAQRLFFAQRIAYKFPDRTRSNSDTLTLVQTLSSELKRIDCTELPNIGYVVLSSGLLSCTLRAPNLDNRYTFKTSRTNKRSRGNELILVNQPFWPKQLETVYEFTTLSDTEKNNLFNFVRVTYGKLITMTDFKGIVRSGVLVTPELEIVQKGDCDYSTTLTLQEYS